MLKRLTTWMLIFAVFATNCSVVFVYAGFKLNQRHIAMTMCINRFRPALRCDGQCYLNQKIALAGENEKKQAAGTNSFRLEAFFFQEKFTNLILESPLTENASHSVAVFSYHYTSQYLASIFRPPKSLI